MLQDVLSMYLLRIRLVYYIILIISKKFNTCLITCVESNCPQNVFEFFFPKPFKLHISHEVDVSLVSFNLVTLSFLSHIIGVFFLSPTFWICLLMISFINTRGDMSSVHHVWYW